MSYDIQQLQNQKLMIKFQSLVDRLNNIKCVMIKVTIKKVCSCSELWVLSSKQLIK